MKILKSIISGALLALSSVSIAQNEGMNWHFGNNTSINFNSGSPILGSSSLISDYNVSTAANEGVASISNASGQLLFYTDGQSVFNNLGSAMPNGTGLLGDQSSTQSGIIIPKPGSSTQYFVFTVDAFSGPDKIKYSIVDMSLNSGLGGVITGKKNLSMPYALTTPTSISEKLTAIPKASGIGFWLITHLSEETSGTNGTFIVWSIDCSASNDGISEHLISGARQMVGSLSSSVYSNALGYMKVSPSKNKIALANTGANFVEVFDFSPNTGVINNAKKATATSLGSGCKPYGVEFSSNSNYLFISDLYSNTIIRYDMSQVAVNSNLDVTGVYTSYTFTNVAPNTYYGNWPSYYKIAALQYAPDGKIYAALPGRDHLLAISNSNNAVPTITENGLTLSTNGSKYCGAGLPNFVPSFLGQASITITGDPCNYLISYSGSSNLPNATYAWNFGDGGTSSLQTPNHQYTTAGTYTITLTVTDNSSGCSATAQQQVNVLSCPCQASTSTQYQKFLVNTTISNSVVWPDKIYIADNVIVTVDNNAILDITNADIVFGRGAGIDFKNGAILRANNSVFRPCDMNDVWRGLTFFQTNGIVPKATINECTFKNAKTAVEAFSNPTKLTYDVRLTNNLFANCQRGIHLNNIVFKNAITGNTYMINDQSLPFNTVSSYYNMQSVTEYYGIYSYQTDYMDLTSQNDFICAAPTGAGNTRVYGIYTNYGANMKITDNKFTDFVVGVYGNRNESISVENNNFSWTSLFNMASAAGNKVQTLINYSNNVLIKNNSIYNANNMNSTATSLPSLTTANIGISSNGSTNIVVAGNFIQGCEMGMSFNGGVNYSNQNLFISENEIKKSWFYGIYVAGYSNTDITCNKIDMELNSTRQTTGISYSNPLLGVSHGVNVYQGSANVGIRSNCVINTKNGIYCYNQNNSVSVPLPKIYNNFVYSYTQYGFENNGFSAVSSAPREVYHNTFMSNNSAMGVVDINTDASHVINLEANFGVQNTNSLVTMTLANTQASTASCAMQTGTFANSLNSYNGSQLCSYYFTSTGWTPFTKLDPAINSLTPTNNGDPDFFNTTFEDPTHSIGGEIINYKDEEFTIHPNPANDLVSIKYNIEKSESTVIEIIDVQGRTIKTVNVDYEMNDLSLDISDLTNGIYIIRMLNDSKAIHHAKLIKQ